MGREERENRAKAERMAEREKLVREGIIHMTQGMARLGDALAVTVVATFTLGEEPDERGMVEARTFNYSAFRSDSVAVPHLEEAERIVRDARTNILLGPPAPEEGSGGVEVDDGGADAVRAPEDHGD